MLFPGFPYGGTAGMLSGPKRRYSRRVESEPLQRLWPSGRAAPAGCGRYPERRRRKIAPRRQLPQRAMAVGPGAIFQQGPAG